LEAEKMLELADCVKIVIQSDSQAALQVNNAVVMSQMVLAAMLNLNILAEKQVVSLWWVRAQYWTH
jgi:hypothetical protein